MDMGRSRGSTVDLFQDQIRGIATGDEGIRDVVGVLVPGGRFGTNSFPTDTQAVGKGTFYVKGVATVKMEVLLFVCRFDVDRGMKSTFTQVDVNVKECSMGLGKRPGKFQL